MTPESGLAIMQRLAAEFGVGLLFADPYLVEVNGLETYVGRSFSSEDTIWIGLYSDGERKLLSFFHELGHVLDGRTDRPRVSVYDNERVAWEVGRRVADRECVRFSEEAWRWAAEQLATYNKPEFTTPVEETV